jgi:protein-S-isoprenylcysteine O-methyltransferase Ste14
MSISATADNPGVLARPPLLYGGTFIAVLVLARLWPMPIFETSVTLWPGLFIAAIGVAIAIWGRRSMEKAGTNVDPTRPTTTIVKSGPFRYSRNPLYVALTLLFAGLTLALNTWWGIALLAPLLAAMHFGVVAREERYLEAKFGEIYRQYRAEVRRYL